jgi:fructose-bisphosphate aldolase class I
MDESNATCGSRLEGVGVENIEENRRRYRELLITTPNLGEHIGGAILFEETLYQSCADGTSFVDALNAQGIYPGIKVDKGLRPLANTNESWCQGLDDLADRAAAYYEQGARFCKWRNTYAIQNGTVSEYQIHHGAETLAKYAQLSQMNGLVPIVEPEVMIDGTHDIHTSKAVSERVWFEVTAALRRHGVIFEAMLLKPNMVVNGADSGKKQHAIEVARATVEALSRTLPAAVPGVFFLSGGLSELQASSYLNAMNALTDLPKPWALRFSYARALQSSALKAWAGKDENKDQARKVFLWRARQNSLATRGQYDESQDDEKSRESLYVKGHVY